MSEIKLTLYRSKKPGKCPHCGEATLWRLGRPPAWKVIHPECYGLYRLDEPPAERDEKFIKALYELVNAFGATSVPTTPAPPPSPIYIRAGPCSWCGRPGIGITADKNLHCRTHLWPPFRWPPPTPLPGGST